MNGLRLLFWEPVDCRSEPRLSRLEVDFRDRDKYDGAPLSWLLLPLRSGGKFEVMFVRYRQNLCIVLKACFLHFVLASVFLIRSLILPCPLSLFACESFSV